MSNININQYSFLKPREWDTLENNLMFFWIDCWDWWDVLLNSLFEVIEEHLRLYPELNFQFIQIKEKYGSLMLYYDWDDDYINNLCTNVEMLSQHICETCWDVWEIRHNLPWYKCLCDKHYLETKQNKDVWLN